MRLIALAMGAVHSATAVMQQSMNEDGISYLDLGDAWLRGDWDAAINGVWSPAYAWLIAAALRIVEPSFWWEFPTVQLVNYAVFVLALACFEFFWHRLGLRYYESGPSPQDATRFPPPAWLVLGYSLFLWISLELIKLWSVSPDMLVAAIVYLAAGILLGPAGRPAESRSGIALGLLLGFGYLVKAALLPLGLVGLALAALAMPGPARKRVGVFFVSVLAMLLVAGPLIAALSWSTGKLTMGDVGRFTYLKHVNEMPFPHFQAAAARLPGEPVNPPRRLFTDPPVYEFATPIAGTYPMAFNPSYWTRGIEPHISLKGQLRAILTSAMHYFDLFFRIQGGFLALVLLLWLLRRKDDPPRAGFGAETALLLWALAAFGMYSIVHVLPRYVGPFVLLFWAAFLVRLRFPAGAAYSRLASLGAVLLIGFVWLNLGTLNLDGLRRVTGFSPLVEGGSQFDEGASHHKARHPQIASELVALGLRPGDRIGYIGYAFSQYWARLARLQIVAEIQWHDQDRFWNASSDTQAGAIAAFATTDAVAVIAEPVGISALPPGWQRLGDTGYLVYFLRQPVLNGPG